MEVESVMHVRAARELCREMHRLGEARLVKVRQLEYCADTIAAWCMHRTRAYVPGFGMTSYVRVCEQAHAKEGRTLVREVTTSVRGAQRRSRRTGWESEVRGRCRVG